MRPILILTLLLLFTACAPRTVPVRTAPAPAATPAPTSFQAMLNKMNAVRRSGFDCGSQGRFGPAGLLSWNSTLALAAEVHARDMAERDFFSHTGSDGSSPAIRVDRVGYPWQLVGENLAYSSPGYFDPVSVVEAWLGSPGHCANLLNPEFTQFGAAMVQGELEYWTQVFATPQGRR